MQTFLIVMLVLILVDRALRDFAKGFIRGWQRT
jgi:hypothetical protein